jgi:hypothetical protein
MAFPPNSSQGTMLSKFLPLPSPTSSTPHRGVPKNFFWEPYTQIPNSELALQKHEFMHIHTYGKSEEGESFWSLHMPWNYVGNCM